jgi:hypothetical protein
MFTVDVFKANCIASLQGVVGYLLYDINNADNAG